MANCNPLHSAQTISDGIHISYSFEYANETARTTAVGLTSVDLGKFARQLDNDSIWMLVDTAPTWVPISNSAMSSVSELEEAIQIILKDLDGYALKTDLDGYALQVDLDSLSNTVDEHYNQHSEAIQTILKELDGYADADAYGTVLMWGDSKITASTTTRYATPGFHNSTAEFNPVQFQLPRGGQLRNMTVTQNVANGNGNNIVYTVRINNVATLLSITIPSTNFTAFNFDDVVSADAADLIDIEITKAVSIAQSPENIIITLELF